MKTSRPCPSGPRIRKIPEGDNRERLVCPDCQFIAYENPKLIVGAVSCWQNRYLLCRRAIAPRTGYWTIPAGFLELGETAAEGAIRETLEETGAFILIDQLLAYYDLNHIGQVHMIFRASIEDPTPIGPRPESLECRLFSWNEIPWSELAFPTVHWALQHHHESQIRGSFAPFTNPQTYRTKHRGL